MRGQPGIDFPIDGMSAEQLEDQARRMVRQFDQMRQPKGVGLRGHNRWRAGRARLAFGAMLCVAAATHMRRAGTATYGRLSPQDRHTIAMLAERRARDLIPPRQTVGTPQ